MTMGQGSLQGKVAWVTGAGRGLGQAIAEGLAEAGAAVILQARSEPELKLVRDKIVADGGEAEIVVGDVTDGHTPQAVTALAAQRWDRLDILVNNAGISPMVQRSEQVTIEDWSRVLEVNLSGAFRCAQAAGTMMLAQGSGSVINMSSVHGQVGFPRLAAYGASKGGLEMLTRSLALEWAAAGVRVNAIAPGYLETQMTEGMRGSDKWAAILRDRIPMGRFGQPRELAGAVVFLASDAASYVTGSILHVDGGWTAQ